MGGANIQAVLSRTGRDSANNGNCDADFITVAAIKHANLLVVTERHYLR